MSETRPPYGPEIPEAIPREGKRRWAAIGGVHFVAFGREAPAQCAEHARVVVHH